jgi:hypothetical protein
MPILPLHHPEPFTATLGVMLYPAMDEEDPHKARAFAAQRLLPGPIPLFLEASQTLSQEDLVRIMRDSAPLLTDLDKRWWGGSAIGEVFKVLLILAHTHPALASWNNAIEYAEMIAVRDKVKGARSDLWKARKRFLSVAHLWGAWSIRERRIDGVTAFQSFLAQAEDLRLWGQTWRSPRAKSKPLLPPDVWHAPDEWKPPKPWPDWPENHFALDPKLVSELKPAGRPRKRG